MVCRKRAEQSIGWAGQAKRGGGPGRRCLRGGCVTCTCASTCSCPWGARHCRRRLHRGSTPISCMPAPTSALSAPTHRKAKRQPAAVEAQGSGGGSARVQLPEGVAPWAAGHWHKGAAGSSLRAHDLHERGLAAAAAAGRATCTHNRHGQAAGLAGWRRTCHAQDAPPANVGGEQRGQHGPKIPHPQQPAKGAAALVGGVPVSHQALAVGHHQREAHAVDGPAR
jgi:hypothetical protein